MRVELSEAARLDLLAYLNPGPDDAPTLEDNGDLVFPGHVDEAVILAAIDACQGMHLVTLKDDLRRAVDAAAEAERLKYISAGAGQAMTYARKVDEARMADTEVNPEPADYPLLAASLGIDGATIADIADVVLQMDAAWTQIGAAIETVRLATKKAISDAADAATAKAAYNAIAWPQP